MTMFSVRAKIAPAQVALEGVATLRQLRLPRVKASQQQLVGARLAQQARQQRRVALEVGQRDLHEAGCVALQTSEHRVHVLRAGQVVHCRAPAAGERLGLVAQRQRTALERHRLVEQALGMLAQGACPPRVVAVGQLGPRLGGDGVVEQAIGLRLQRRGLLVQGRPLFRVKRSAPRS